MKAKSREAFSKNHIHGGAVESNFRHCDAKAKKSCRALQSLKLRPHRGSHFSVSSSVSEPASRKELVFALPPPAGIVVGNPDQRHQLWEAQLDIVEIDPNMSIPCLTGWG